MSLSDFIEANLDELVEDWAEFAGHLMRDGLPLTPRELQNSARHMLQRLAVDMRTHQTSAEQEAKSRGENGGGAADVTAVAHEHADDRLSQGFALNDLVAEFRALRATVLRRWQRTSTDQSTAFAEMVRFNEVMDHALAESIRQYALRVTKTRDRFAGILAHDLRSPLGAIANSSELLMRDENLSSASIKAVANIQRSATRMRRMVDDLLDFTRTRLGDTLPVDIASQDAGRVCSNACEEVHASYPQANIGMSFEGDLSGHWDADRLSQLIVNLLVNAIQHGSGSVRLFARDEGENISIDVENEGNGIPRHMLANIFDPLTRTYSLPEQRGTAAGIGLGLYICKCIAQAHRGSIGVTSLNTITKFTVVLPRVPKVEEKQTE